VRDEFCSQHAVSEVGESEGGHERDGPEPVVVAANVRADRFYEYGLVRLGVAEAAVTPDERIRGGSDKHDADRAKE